MTLLDNLKVRSKLLLIVGATVVGMMVISGFMLMNLRSQMIDDRKAQVQNIAEAAYGIIEFYHAKADSGALAVDDAKRAALEDLRKMRYGAGNSEYVWVNDFRPVMLMHPAKPQLEGKDIGEIKAPDGSFLFMGMIKFVQDNKAGFYLYDWPKPGSDTPVHKVSYIKSFEPWGVDRWDRTLPR